MKVAVVNLTSGGLSGGYAKYLSALLPLLAGDRRIASLHVFAAPSVASSYTFPVPVVTWPEGDGSRGYRGLRARLVALAPDVVFFPTARRVHASGIPTVVMVRNMEPLTVPFGGNTCAEGLRNLGRAAAAYLACRRATRVIAVSEHVRSYLVRRWRLDPSRIGLVYHGVDPVEGAAHETRPAGIAGGAPFLFTAGSIRPARGIEDAIAAMPALGQRHPDLRLVIAGHADRSGLPYAARLTALAQRLGVDHAVAWAGPLTAREMSWAFSHCAAFIVTSRAEACPNLALEAMAHGARVVSTTQPPMPEFFGQDAAYYSPGHPASLAASVLEILTDSSEADRRARAARARVSRFSWPQTADKTIEELQRARESAS